MGATARKPGRLPLPETIVVGLAVAIGIGLRFWTESPLWLDEALTVNTARLALADIPEALGRDGLPPLYYGLLHAWMAVFGEGDLAVRALAGVLSVATLPVMYLAGRRLGGHRLGLIATALLALNPYAIRYATETRMYALIMLLVLVGYLTVDAALRNPRLGTLAGVAAVTAGLMYSHYWTFWLLGAVAIAVGFRAWRPPDPADRSAALRVLAAMVVGGLAFIPWLPTFLDQAAHTATPWAGASRPTQILSLTLADFGGGDVGEATLLAFGLGVLFLLGVFAHQGDGLTMQLDLHTIPQTRGPAVVTMMALGLGGAVGLITASAFATRYAAVVFPLFLLVAAAGASRFSARWTLALVTGSVLVMGLVVCIHDARVDRTQAGEIAAAIVAGDPEGTPLGEPLVVYCPDQLGPAVHRELPAGQFDQVIFPELESEAVDSPERVDWYDYADRQDSIPPEEVAEAILERAGPDNGIWVVFSPSYRTVDDRCIELVDALGRQRSGRAVVIANPDEFFEHAGLQLYLPAAP